MCQAFEFKHLPMPGGIYDQNPEILERFLYIMQEQEKQRQREEKKRKHSETGPRRGRGSSRPTY